MEIRNGLYTLVEIHDIEFLIGRVQVVAIQSKTHEHDLDTQLFFQYGTNWNTAPATNRYRLFAKGGLDGFGSRLICF